MNRFSKFWSNWRNRSVIYALGFLLVFGSYVIGAPTLTGAKKPKKKTSMAVSSIQNNDFPEEVPIEITDVNQVASDGAAPVVAKVEAPIQPKPWTSGVSDTTYPSSEPFEYPVSQMNASSEVKQKIAEQVKAEGEEYPYEKQDDEVLDEAAQENVAAGKEGVYWPARGSFQAKSKKEDSSTSKNEKKENGSIESKKTGSSQKFFTSSGGSRSSTKNNEGSNLEKEENEPETNNSDSEYDPAINNPTYPWLANFYNNVHIYSFKKGFGGSSRFPSFTLDQENDFYKIRDVIFRAPDWKMSWKKFTKAPVEEAVKTHLLPFGVNGSLTIQIQGGHIYNGKGPDFLVVENPFCEFNGELIEGKTSSLTAGDDIECDTEFASVSVANFPEGPYFTFQPCDGSKTNSASCAGIVPNVYKYGRDLRNSGGDLFDLESLKKVLPKGFEAKFIRIQDMQNTSGDPGTKGFDLDSFVPFYLKTDPIPVADPVQGASIKK